MLTYFLIVVSVVIWSMNKKIKPQYPKFNIKMKEIIKQWKKDDIIILRNPWMDNKFYKKKK